MSHSMEKVSDAVPAEYQTPEAQRTLANHLRNGVKCRAGIEHDKRVDYFKGFQYSCF